MYSFNDYLKYEFKNQSNNCKSQQNESLYGLICLIKTKTPLSLSMLKGIIITFTSSPSNSYINIYSIKPIFKNTTYSPLIKIPKIIKHKIYYNDPLLEFKNRNLINHTKHLQLAMIKPMLIPNNGYNPIYSIEILQ